MSFGSSTFGGVAFGGGTGFPTLPHNLIGIRKQSDTFLGANGLVSVGLRVDSFRGASGLISVPVNVDTFLSPKVSVPLNG